MAHPGRPGARPKLPGSPAVRRRLRLPDLASLDRPARHPRRRRRPWPRGRPHPQQSHPVRRHPHPGHRQPRYGVLCGLRRAERLGAPSPSVPPSRPTLETGPRGIGATRGIRSIRLCTWCGADARVSGRPTACSRNQNATARARSDVMANPNQPTLNPGVTGPAVRRLQRALRRGESRGLVVDGAFGPKTEAAVRSLQAGHDLVVDGIVGPATWAALPDGGAMPLLRRGSAGDVVMALQRLLAAAASEGWPSPGAADGDFGPQTEAAVRGFQAWGGVVVDGVGGDQTWSVSLNALGRPSGAMASTPAVAVEHSPVRRSGPGPARPSVPRLES